MNLVDFAVAAAELPPSVVVTTGECWRVPTERARGYASKGDQQAHRWTYETFVGPVPAGLELDQVCHTWDLTCPGGPACLHRACVNPAHLEPVTPAENRRRTLIRVANCPSGHPYAGANLIYTSEGARACRTCHRERDIARDRRRGVRPKRRPDHDTHCAQGHEYTLDNLITDRANTNRPVKACRTCRRAAQRKYKAARRAS